MEAQGPNSQRLSTHSRRSSALPHPPPGKVDKASSKPARNGKSLFPPWKGRLKQGAQKGEEGKGPESCRDQGEGAKPWSFTVLQEEVVVGHAQRGQEHRVLLEVDLLVTVLVQALHQDVDAALLHLLQGPSKRDKSATPPSPASPLHSATHALERQPQLGQLHSEPLDAQHLPQPTPSVGPGTCSALTGDSKQVSVGKLVQPPLSPALSTVRGNNHLDVMQCPTEPPWQLWGTERDPDFFCPYRG